MERVAGSAATTTSSHNNNNNNNNVYVSWEEVFVWNDKGKREVRYFLKRRGGGSDLAVVGKEKTFRHMSYHFVLRNPSFTPFFKLKSRREVIHWFHSIISGSSSGDAIMVRKQGCEPDIRTLKDNQLQRLRHSTKKFSWLGDSWICRKRRKHYTSFKRNGFQISVHNFVFVLAEEDKRLVAYLEDLYEDSRGNKMVVVRWFHKIDEVGIALPHSFSDREVFFSLYLQDLSIECIDGLTFVLSPQHYEKFQNEACHTHLEPFVCKHQFDNDDVKSFDITQIKGYWEQEILCYMYSQLDSKSNGGSGHSDDTPELDDNHQSSTLTRPKKRLRHSKDDGKDAVDLAGLKLEKLNEGKNDSKISSGNNTLKLVGHTKMKTSEGTNEYALKHLLVGSQVEVLSQDSGMRGCWFRALVIKKHKDKVKLQYLDLEDADDETKKVEEWVRAARIAVPDDLGLRMCGRTTIRPAPESNKRELSWSGDVGSIVDTWWHDGWWEGILVQKDSEANYHVYFPGEKVVSIFGPGGLRHSQDWVGNEWVVPRERPDLVSSILSSLKTKNLCKSLDSKSTIASTTDGIQSMQTDTCLDSERDRLRKSKVVPDLLKDNSLSQLRWKCTKKRRRGHGNSDLKFQHRDSHRKKSPKSLKPEAPDSFVIPASLKVDNDDYKYAGDPSIFSSSVVPSLTNLVMCR